MRLPATVFCAKSDSVQHSSRNQRRRVFCSLPSKKAPPAEPTRESRRAAGLGAAAGHAAYGQQLAELGNQDRAEAAVSASGMAKPTPTMSTAMIDLV